MQRRTFLQTCAAVTVLSDIPLGAESAAGLEEAFRQPPASARPMTWWHWMNGNITADGITRDLEAMQRAGVGGFQIFQAGTGIPKGPVAYGSAAHVSLLEHAAKEADRLGLEFGMHNCPGWSSSGGPWITPELSMQQLVWSETYVEGGRKVNAPLAQPFTKRGYYRDICVLAFPSLQGEDRPMREMLRTASSSSGLVDRNLLTDGDLSTTVEIAGEPPKLLLEMTEPVEAQSIDLYIAPTIRSVGILLESSEDGVAFQRICDVMAPYARTNSVEAAATANFPPTRARYFRLTFPRPALVRQAEIHAAARIADWPAKTNSARGGANPPQAATTEVPRGSVIQPDSVLDISRFMKPDGRLEWDAPAGKWTILRFGHTVVGMENHPAPDGGGGLECDKFSRDAMDFHFRHFFGPLFASMAPLTAKHMAGAIIDSYEVGMQTWTASMPQEFEKRRGYDLKKYMPALTGRIVGSAENSDRFLWDIRRTHSDLMADNYYGRFAELCRERGIKAYTEPYDGGPFDEMQSGSRVDVPMGEFWHARRTAVNRSVKLAASIAHVNGRPIAAAESFTGYPTFSKWQEYPYSLKAQGDWMHTEGLNEFIFHRFAHQPHPDALPGMTMGQWGIHFDRTNTWWNPGRAWLDYAARCHHMLRQGVFMADLLYFEGESSPKAAPTAAELNPAPPAGYDWDTIDRDSVLKRVKIEDGQIALPGGARYRALVLPPSEPGMTLALLRKLRELVRSGLCLVGAKPELSAGVMRPEDEAEFRKIAAEVWGETGGAAATERVFGSGRVFQGASLRAVLEKLGAPPDFEFSARSGDAPINWIHRRAGDTEIYFIANRRRRAEDLVCSFRVDGKRPEFWNADTGETILAPVYDAAEGRVRVPVRLDPAGSMFVVFRSPAARRLISIAKDSVAMMGTAPFPEVSAGRYPDVVNSFTITLWAQPDTDLDLSSMPASFAIYPPAGETVYEPGHAACGLTIARNGVCVYERVRGNPVAVMTIPRPVAGWTHFALVYREGTPALYVDGKLAGQGNPSASAVHPGMGAAYQNDGAWYFEGNMTEPELAREALDAAGIAQLAQAGMPAPEGPPAVEPARGGLLFWEGGRYTLVDDAGEVADFEASGIEKPIPLGGPWSVLFPAKRGAPPSITLPGLMSLHRHSDPGVKYFSGTAAYRKRFRLPLRGAKGRRLYLDLGRVAVLAQPRLNGRDLGTLWKPPYRVDVTAAARPGENELEVLVTNLWPNRLIGDEHLPPENEYGATNVSGAGGGGMALRKVPEWYIQGKPKPGARVTFTTWKHYSKDDPLLESGLLGPVMLRTALWREREG